MAPDDNSTIMNTSITSEAMPKKSLLLAILPPETILDIVGCLRLPDVMRLYRTCTAMYRLLRVRFLNTFESAPDDIKYECLTVHARDWADKWACDKCIAVHGILWNDAPNHTQREEEDEIFPCPQREPSDLHFTPDWNGYEVEYHHVQMALKCHRFDLTFLQRHYLELLLAPYLDSISIEHLPVDHSYHAEPRVIKGRYLRKATWMFRPRMVQLSYPDLGDVQACCHLSNSTAVVPLPLPRLEYAIKRCLQSQSTIIALCRECATEVEISCWAGTDPWLRMVAYQDLGTEDDTSGDNWRAADCGDTFTKNFRPLKLRALWGDSYPARFEPFID